MWTLGAAASLHRLVPPAGLAALGIGLLLAPVPHSGLGRLKWLAASRFGGDNDGAGPRSGGSAVPRLPGILARGWVWAVATAALVAAAIGPVPGTLAGVSVSVLSGCRKLLNRERDVDRARTELEAATFALVEEYAAGATVAGAFTAAAPVAGRYRAVLARVGTFAAAGAEPEAVLTADPALAALRVACAVVSRTGASLSDVLAGVRAELAVDRITRRAVQAAVTGPRSSALLLTGLPLLGLVMGSAIGAHPSRVLLHTAPGLTALTAGVVLDLAGLCWTLALTRQRDP